MQVKRILPVIHVALLVGGLALGALGWMRMVPALSLLHSPDLGAYYLAAATVHQSPTAIYDERAIAETAKRLHIERYTPYIYPPTLAVVLQPLLHWPFPQACTLWFLLDLLLIMLIAGLVIYQAHRDGEPIWVGVLVVCLWLTLPALAEELTVGQIDLWLTLGVWLAFAASGSRRCAVTDTLAGFALGMSSVLKFFPLATIPWLLLRRRWALVAVTILSLTGLLLLGGAVAGWTSLSYYFRNVLPNIADSAAMYGSLANNSLHSLLQRLAAGGPVHFTTAWATGDVTADWPAILPLPAASALRVIFVALIGGLSAWMLLSRRSSSSKGSAEWGYSLSLLTVLLIGPILWPSYTMLALVPLYTFARHRHQLREPWRTIAVLSYLCLIGMRYWRPLLWYSQSPLALHLGLYGLFGLWVAMMGLGYSVYPRAATEQAP